VARQVLGLPWHHRDLFRSGDSRHDAGVTRVARVVTMTVPRRLRLIQPVLVRAFRAESTRTLMALKACADTLA
jgi:hypothetical protein